MTWECVIGLEVHVRLATATKIFCGCVAGYGAPPNSQICPVCSGQPGALPVLNARAVELAARLALALGCRVHRRSAFDRKGYFYPDLPRGFQITQYQRPLASGGALPLVRDGELLQLPLERAHLEEDAGKTIHRPGDGLDLVDLNRAGVPLVEIVGRPWVVTPATAADALRALRRLVRALGVGDGNMEQGALRCDANISLRRPGSQRLGKKVELKNLNSFRFVERALRFEEQRQTALLEAGRPVLPETRRWDDSQRETRPSRRKEAAPDYRYFPEPDLPDLVLPPGALERWAGELPELPHARELRLARKHGLRAMDAAALCRAPALADYFEAAVAAGAPARRAAAWIQNELLSLCPDPTDIAGAPVEPAALAGLLHLLERGRLSGPLARRVWGRMWQTGLGAEEIARAEGLFVERAGEAARALVRQVLADHEEQAAALRAGKDKLLGFFIGQVMARSGGKVEPREIKRLLQEELRR